MMNNDAFRELVHQGGKTTKQIAREAVEDEFERHTKKRKKKGFDSSDEDDDNDDGDTSNNKKKKKKHAPRKHDKKKSDTTAQYRDRAQERREGKIDDTEFATTTAGNISAEMTKYLGGDERHTHLVRGLDVTLARRVKRGMMGRRRLVNSTMEGCGDEAVSKRAAAEAAEEETEIVLVETVAEAKQLIQNWSTPSSTTEEQSALGISILALLRRRQLATTNKVDDATTTTTNRSRTNRLQVSSAGQTLQRTSLTFSCIGHPGDAWRAWEVPEEQTSMNNTASTASTDDEWWFSPNLLDQVHDAFARTMKKQDRNRPTTTTMKRTNGTKQPKDDGDVNISDDDDDDDDIFADAGDYVPTEGDVQTTAATITNESLFAGLPTNAPKEEESSSSIQEDGMTIVAKLAQRTRPDIQSGDFCSQYHGAYGEDGMDVDFSGQCEGDDDHDDDKKKKKKKGDETTTASREYGKRGKPMRDGVTED